MVSRAEQARLHAIKQAKRTVSMMQSNLQVERAAAFHRSRDPNRDDRSKNSTNKAVAHTEARISKLQTQIAQAEKNPSQYNPAQIKSMAQRAQVDLASESRKAKTRAGGDNPSSGNSSQYSNQYNRTQYQGDNTGKGTSADPYKGQQPNQNLVSPILKQNKENNKQSSFIGPVKPTFAYSVELKENFGTEKKEESVIVPSGSLEYLYGEQPTHWLNVATEKTLKSLDEYQRWKPENPILTTIKESALDHLVGYGYETVSSLAYARNLVGELINRKEKPIEIPKTFIGLSTKNIIEGKTQDAQVKDALAYIQAKGIQSVQGELGTVFVAPWKSPVRAVSVLAPTGETVATSFTVAGKVVASKITTGVDKGKIIFGEVKPKVVIDFSNPKTILGGLSREVGQGGKVQASFNRKITQGLYQGGVIDKNTFEYLSLIDSAVRKARLSPSKIYSTGEMSVDSLTVKENKKLFNLIKEIQDPKLDKMAVGQLGGSLPESIQRLPSLTDGLVLKGGDYDIVETGTKAAQLHAAKIAKGLSATGGAGYDVYYLGTSQKASRRILSKGFESLPVQATKNPTKQSGEAVLKIITSKDKTIIGIKQIGIKDKEFSKILRSRKEQSKGILVKDVIKNQKQSFKVQKKLGLIPNDLQFAPKIPTFKKDEILFERLLPGGKTTYGTWISNPSKKYKFIPTGDRLTKVSKVVGDTEKFWATLPGKNVYYQGTTREIANKILKKGFDPKKAGTATEAHIKRMTGNSDYAKQRASEISPKGTIFLTPNAKRAFSFMEDAIKSQDEKGAVVRVQLKEDALIKRLKTIDPKKEHLKEDIKVAKKEGFKGILKRMGGEDSNFELILFDKKQVESVSIVKQALRPVKDAKVTKIGEHLDNKDLVEGNLEAVMSGQYWGKGIKGKGIIDPSTGVKIERLPEQTVKRLTSMATIHDRVSIQTQLSKLHGKAPPLTFDKYEIIASPLLKRAEKDIIYGHYDLKTAAYNLQNIKVKNPYRLITNPKKGRELDIEADKLKQTVTDMNPGFNYNKILDAQKQTIRLTPKEKSDSFKSVKDIAEKVPKNFVPLIDLAHTPTAKESSNIKYSILDQELPTKRMDGISMSNYHRSRIPKPLEIKINSPITSRTVSRATYRNLVRDSPSSSSSKNTSKKVNDMLGLSSGSSKGVKDNSSKGLGSLDYSVISGSLNSLKSPSSGSPGSPGVGSPGSPRGNSRTSLTGRGALRFSQKRFVLGIVPIWKQATDKAPGKRKESHNFLGSSSISRVGGIYNVKDIRVGDKATKKQYRDTLLKENKKGKGKKGKKETFSLTGKKTKTSFW